MISLLRSAARWALAALLIGAGLSHLTWNRVEFRELVPSWVPLGADQAVLASGVVEIVLGVMLFALHSRRRQIGAVVAAWFIVVLPGNIHQLVVGSDAFGLDSDFSRALRVALQPLLVVWALWSTTASPRRERRAHRRRTSA